MDTVVRGHGCPCPPISGYGQFCELVCETFPELVVKGGWGAVSSDPKDILLLFLDSDGEIVRIRNGISFSI